MLKDDAELYVRRSVANNLNDISKDNSEVVVSTLTRWGQSSSEEMQRLIRRALRTLLKQGNVGALGLLGYESPGVSVAALSLQNQRVLKEGGLIFRFSFVSEKSQKLMIDYRIYYMKSNWKQAPKTFKWADRTVKAGDVGEIPRKQLCKTISTHKHYRGRRKIEIIVNGQAMAESDFECD